MELGICLLYEKQKGKVVNWHKRELRGGERIFSLSPMVGWFELKDDHNLVVKL